MAPRAADSPPAGAIRDRLASAAFELFGVKGYAATTIDDIVERAGIGRRTFFRYYRSKEDVIFPDHDQLLATVQHRMDLDPNERAMDAVFHAVRLVLEHYVETPEISLQRYKLVGEVPALRERELVSAAAYQRQFRERIAREGDDEPNTILRAELLASAVTTAHNHVLREWLRTGGTTEPFGQLDRSLAYVRDLFLGRSGTAEDDNRRLPGRARLVVAAFDDSVTTEAIAAEIEKLRGTPRSAPRRPGASS